MAEERAITTEASLPLGFVNAQLPLPSGRLYDHVRLIGSLGGTVTLGTTPRTSNTAGDKAAIKAIESGGKKLFKAS